MEPRGSVLKWRGHTCRTLPLLPESAGRSNTEENFQGIALVIQDEADLVNEDLEGKVVVVRGGNIIPAAEAAANAGATAVVFLEESASNF